MDDSRDPSRWRRHCSELQIRCSFTMFLPKRGLTVREGRCLGEAEAVEAVEVEVGVGVVVAMRLGDPQHDGH